MAQGPAPSYNSKGTDRGDMFIFDDVVVTASTGLLMLSDRSVATVLPVA